MTRARSGIRLLAITAGLAGLSSADDATFRSNANLVVLEVAITDAGGTPVAGVPKERFRVLENGKPQAIKQFSAGESPVSMGFVIDCSASMSEKAANLRRAVQALLAASNPADEYFLVAFNDGASLGLPAGHSFAREPDQISRALLQFRTAGRTALHDGLLMAVRHGGQSMFERRVLVLVSDGKDNASRSTLDQVLHAVRSTPITIHTIGLYSPDDEDQNGGFLRQLARISGGHFYHPSNPSQLEADCLEIARDVRARYTLAYTPQNQEDPRQAVRKIEVQLNRQAGEPRRIVTTRKEYTLAAKTDGVK